ncbi:hypothetical protein Q2941_36985, partial [Bradyrhizobium sp. UFLA05-153]
ASDFNLDDKLQNVILAVFQSFAFLHSQGHSQLVQPAASPGVARYAARSGSLRHFVSAPPLRPPIGTADIRCERENKCQ